MVEQLELMNLLWFLLKGENSQFLVNVFEVKLENTICYEQHIQYKDSVHLLTGLSLLFQIKTSRNYMRTGW